MSTSEPRRALVGLMLWLTALITQSVIGYAVAPVLFAQLDRGAAGHIAGMLLNGVEWLAVVLVIVGILVWPRRTAAWLGGAFVMLQAVQLLWLNPAMADLKRSGAAASSQFMALHGFSQAVYLTGVGLLAGLVITAWRTLIQCDANA